jgi:hypothetical protein
LTDGSLVQFGWGSQQRRIQAAEVDSTSAIAASIAQDKDLTKKLLHAAGVPVPPGRPVLDANDAWVAAQAIGTPVVVKPRDGNQGKGVTVNISTREEIEAAFHNAAKFRDEVMVERFLPGSDYRLLVVGDKLVAAARRGSHGVMAGCGFAVALLRAFLEPKLRGLPATPSGAPVAARRYVDDMCLFAAGTPAVGEAVAEAYRVLNERLEADGGLVHAVKTVAVGSTPEARACLREALSGEGDPAV